MTVPVAPQQHQVPPGVQPTDLEMFRWLLDKWGVPYMFSAELNEITIKVTESDNPKLTGYLDFACDFSFGPAGQFDRMGIWE